MVEIILFCAIMSIPLTLLFQYLIEHSDVRRQLYIFLSDPLVFFKYDSLYMEYYLKTRKKFKIAGIWVKRTDQIHCIAYISKTRVEDRWAYETKEIQGEIIGLKGDLMYIIDDGTGNVITYNIHCIDKKHFLSLNGLSLQN